MAFDTVLHLAITHPYQLVAFTILASCLLTRLITTLRFASKPVHVFIDNTKSSTKAALTVPVIPYWIPWIGHTAQFAVAFTDYIGEVSRRYRVGAFSLIIAGQKHNMVLSPGLVKQILDGRSLPVSNTELIFRVMEKVWDDKGAIRAMDPEVVWGPIHKALVGMMRDEFVTNGLKATVKGVEERMWNLVGGASSWVDHSAWERVGRVEILDERKNGEFVAEVDLHKLLRDFVGDIASGVLMGSNFMENNPSALSDLWQFDSKFTTFMLGIPSWFPGMVGPSMARERLVRGVSDHHIAYLKYLKGEDPGSQWSDMSDVSNIIADRAKAMAAAGVSPRTHGVSDAVILWAMNVNANQLIFWMVWYIFSDPQLLAEIRAEIAPFVQQRRSDSESDFGIKPAPALSIDLQALKNSCPLLNGAFLETMRLESLGVSYKYVEDDFVVTETEDDARVFGRTRPETYVFRKGEMLCLPHAAHQTDERYWANAQTFNARRFWTTDAEKADGSTTVKVDYGTMKVWGGGKSMCKGRKFAESEVLLFVSAVVMCWNIEPMNKAGRWIFPGRVTAGSSSRPKVDPRVRIWRRQF